ncbi:MAG: hybrid sensor histidine kinase/response regulator [Ottowia sp.]|uniref:ATP-binding response regulator n=1 Tax=Ottowia sp. TaxID=1898956 RepID=UPI003C750689
MPSVHVKPAAAGGAPASGALERSQAIVRMTTIYLGVGYMTYQLARGRIPPDNRTVIATLCVVIAIGSLLLLLAVLRWPQPNRARRILGTAHDYAAILVALIFGGEALLPIYALLLWTTIGNGYRYGARYHLVAVAVALLTLVAVGQLNDYVRGQPYLLSTLFLTAILVPAYGHVLVTRLYRARDEAMEASRAKSRFLAQASHDLRQPIHAISLYTACLRDTGLDAEQRQMVASIDRSLNSVSQLFRSLLDLSVLDSGRAVVKAEAIALDHLLNDIARQNAETAQWSGVTLKVVPTRSRILADAGLLGTVLQNIVSNALKYASGGPVLIGCRRQGHVMAIQVYDRGPGIAEQHLPQVFDEFYRIHAPGDRDIDGVGLGLSIVRRLTALMGLSVSIRSVVGKGTCVTVSGLPLIAAEPAGPAAPRMVSAPTVIGGYKVLLIEDDPLVLAATATLLESWGCAVRRETGMPGDGSEDCDLVLTDFDLGEKTTGSECIAEVRRRTGRQVPAIVMTGHDPEKVRQLTEQPDVVVLSKPVRPAELRSVIVAQRLTAHSTAEG